MTVEIRRLEKNPLPERHEIRIEMGKKLLGQ